MLNTFPARERAFINRLAEDLHLSVRWDEYDENDNNIVTWRLPGVLENDNIEEDIEKSSLASANVIEENAEEPPDSEWEDVSDEDEDDEESRAAVDRVLQKYEKAPTFDDDADGGFEARYERSIKEKMDEWKRGYYQVDPFPTHICNSTNNVDRESWRYRMMTRRRWATWYIDTWRDYSGLCTIITAESRLGDGSTTIITRRAFPVRCKYLWKTHRRLSSV